MTIKDTPKSTDPWHDDVLDRKTLGKVLEDHLINRFNAGNNGPLSIALDGRWGSGKTFFVERWIAQLKQNGRFVISFNAWQHDGAPEPSLALISELRNQLTELRKSLNSLEANTDAIDSNIKAAITSIKKAVKPVAIAATNGFVKRLIGSSITDLINAASDDDGEETCKQTANSETKILDKALDAYFDQALEGYGLHQASIERFHNDLRSLAKAISSTSNGSGEPIGPIIIIIDELDRCRPNFAVQLLEGIKHLFSVDNVCFVFATNLAQLTASVQVVYGSNFSGREYLGRFFDRELTLPIASGIGFSKLLFQNTSFTSQLAMGSYSVDGDEVNDKHLSYWIALSQAMNLTLRQQQQAFVTLQTSCEAYDPTIRLPGVWLMFLSQLKTALPDIFTTLIESPSGGITTTQFQQFFSSTSWNNKTLTASISHYRSSTPNTPSLLSLLAEFFKFSKLPMNLAYREIEQNETPLSNQVDSYISRFTNDSQLSLLESSFRVVSTAGMFSY